MSVPRTIAERCPSCAAVAGYIAKQSPQRQTIRCAECEHEWKYWRGVRPGLRYRKAVRLWGRKKKVVLV